jgi:hypothetical protein
MAVPHYTYLVLKMPGPNGIIIVKGSFELSDLCDKEFLKMAQKEVSLAHLAREVDLQPSHPGSSPHRREFGFLFSKNQNRCRGFPYRISFQKKYMFSICLV